MHFRIKNPKNVLSSSTEIIFIVLYCSSPITCCAFLVESEKENSKTSSGVSVMEMFGPT